MRVVARFEAVPAPTLTRLIFDERPEFINLQVFNAWWHARLSDLRGVLTNALHDRIGADPEHARDIADAAGVHCHRHDQGTHDGLGAAIGVLRNELATTTPAPVLLFSIGGCAILLDVPRGTARTSDFFKAHTSKNSLSESLFQSSINSETRPFIHRVVIIKPDCFT
jgi:hypothetical protein